MKITVLVRAVLLFFISFSYCISLAQAASSKAETKTTNKKSAMQIIKTSICFGKNFDTFDRRTSQYDKSINKYGAKYGISVALIKSVITAESCFDSEAVSPKGAQGLMQLMPATAERFGVSDSFNPDQNIRGGTRYLQFLLKYFDDDLLNAIAAYNSGEGTVKKYDGIPPYKETREYVSKVSTLYRFFAGDGLEKKKRYDEFKKGDHPATFFIPRAMPRSRLSPYINHARNVARGANCRNRTSTRLKRSTKLVGGRKGVWQRLYIAQKGETLRLVESKTGINKRKLMQMNGIGSRARLKQGQEVLVWECRK